MAFDYTKPMFGEPVTAAPASATAVTEPATDQQPRLSEAVAKFKSCRWRKPAEDGSPECCSHRDVLPITGVHGFDPEAWCPECTFYKLRRTPKKRSPDDYRY